jgi:hypothetical protein
MYTACQIRILIQNTQAQSSLKLAGCKALRTPCWFLVSQNAFLLRYGPLLGVGRWQLLLLLHNGASFNFKCDGGLPCQVKVRMV